MHVIKLSGLTEKKYLNEFQLLLHPTLLWVFIINCVRHHSNEDKMKNYAMLSEVNNVNLDLIVAPILIFLCFFN